MMALAVEQNCRKVAEARALEAEEKLALMELQVSLQRDSTDSESSPRRQAWVSSPSPHIIPPDNDENGISIDDDAPGSDDNCIAKLIE
jgi:hypothetical protein